MTVDNVGAYDVGSHPAAGTDEVDGVATGAAGGSK
jgi:hypothetical protein